MAVITFCPLCQCSVYLSVRCDLMFIPQPVSARCIRITGSTGYACIQVKSHSLPAFVPVIPEKQTTAPHPSYFRMFF